jgi:hypothetical protein
MKKVFGSQPIELGVTGKEPGTIKITVKHASSSLEGMLFICKKQLRELETSEQPDLIYSLANFLTLHEIMTLIEE